MTEETNKGIESIENLIQNYIFEHKLTDGTRLPPSQELAAQCGCDEDSLITALRSAEAKRRLSYEQGAWTVISPETLSDHSFSFTKSARARGLTTEVLEATARPPISDKEHPFYLVEQRVQEALGLATNSKFIIIERLRLLGGRPGALQRAYLSPGRFPENFLKSHNFKTESLIGLYQQNGYKLLSRDTILAARFANLYEKNTLNRYSPGLQASTVLDAEQCLYAEDPRGGSRFVLEFLKASYLENWRYEIKNRSTSTQP